MEELAPLDVRDDLRNGQEPLQRILAVVQGLAPGQGLRLRTTFEPIPLYALLARKGYVYEAQRHGPEDWEIVFRPDPAATVGRPERAAPAGAGPAGDWPAPTTHLDNRGLLPPEPMVRILQTLERLAPGAVLAAVNDREPMFLLPELEARGHAIHIDKRSDGVHLTIRRGGDQT